MDVSILDSLPREELSQAESLLMQGDLATFLARLSKKQRVQLRYKWDFWARPDQLLPEHDDWDILLCLSGRGSGKTRTGAEGVHAWARTKGRHFALVGETAAECRDVEPVFVCEEGTLKLGDVKRS